MDKILNIETSTRICSVTIGSGDHILASREQSGTFEHARILHPFIQEVLAESNTHAKDLAAVAVSEGPGSYTGLRIGVSAAKGICYAQDLPLISISTLKAMAMRAIDETGEKDYYYAPMIDARRMEVYTAVFDNSGESKMKVSAKIIEERTFSNFRDKPLIYFGDGAEKCTDVLQGDRETYHNGGFPSAFYMHQLANDKYHLRHFEDVAYFEPFYLKDFIAGKPKVKGLGN